jgi:hypothetical protein
MTLKKLAILSGVALLILATTGCTFLAPRLGNLSFEIPLDALQELYDAPQNAEGRALWTGTPATRVRVYLESNGALINLQGGGVVFETDIPGNRIITIENLPPASNCRLYISLSAAATPFRTLRFFSSSTFQVVSGATRDITLSWSDSPFDDIFIPSISDPKGIKAAVVETGIETGIFNRYFAANGSVFLKNPEAEAQTLREGLGIINSLSAGNVLVPGLAVGEEVVTEASLGDPQLWINTNSGILTLPPEGSYITQKPDITESGVIHLKFTKEADAEEGTPEEPFEFDLAFYQRRGSIGFGLVSGAEWEWQDLVDDMLSSGDGEGTSTEDQSTIDKFINPNSNIIAGYAVDEHSKFAYFITALGTYRLDGDTVDKLVAPGEGEEKSINQILTEVLDPNMISIPNQKIQALDYAGGRLTIGTDKGIWNSMVDPETGKPASLVSAGINANVVRVRSRRFEEQGDNSWTATAALTSAGTVMILKNGVLFRSYRFFTGIPSFGGNATANGNLLWTDEGLIITGTDSAVLLPKSTIQGFN